MAKTKKKNERLGGNMTNLEKEALNTLAERLRSLASLENAGFNADKEKDEAIKKAIKPYMLWFECLSYDIEEVINLSEKSGYVKKEGLEEIIRLNV